MWVAMATRTAARTVKTNRRYHENNLANYWNTEVVIHSKTLLKMIIKTANKP